MGEKYYQNAVISFDKLDRDRLDLLKSFRIEYYWNNNFVNAELKTGSCAVL